ncbi:MAG: hypothetical protein PHW93_05095 [Candidatus Methanomethylophilaceae archaeon]|nr:hypothetical protein [Candidatus Methanomethylophilaceae archaeon]
MFSPEKDFHKIVIETLGKEGKSISSLAKELEKMGFKHHRLILTGYLRALTDIKILKEREIPPAKVYIPAKQSTDTIYEKVGKRCREISTNPNDLILYTLNRLFRRPIFEIELNMAGILDPIGIEADEESIKEARRVLKKAGVQTPNNQAAFLPSKMNLDPEYIALIESILIEIQDIRHLLLDTRQTKLI